MAKASCRYAQRRGCASSRTPSGGGGQQTGCGACAAVAPPRSCRRIRVDARRDQSVALLACARTRSRPDDCRAVASEVAVVVDDRAGSRHRVEHPAAIMRHSPSKHATNQHSHHTGHDTPAPGSAQVGSLSSVWRGNRTNQDFTGSVSKGFPLGRRSLPAPDGSRRGRPGSGSGRSSLFPAPNRATSGRPAPRTRARMR